MTEQPVLPEGRETLKLNEVCKLAGVQPYMLRFWGQEFPQLEAGKSRTGQRVFRRDQVELILEIKRLLFDEGLTIAGARKRLDNAGVPAPVRQPVEQPAPDSIEVAGAAVEQIVETGADRGKKVDKRVVENVQTLLATLRDVRKELVEAVEDLKIDEVGT